ncbi:GTP-binding protein [Gulosibacter bifidus]|uniref:GTP-binding protein n=1 Tax=Gulosibacter bifidus TaxID=272239 RepID=A0ABW5RF75_9MICO|nr:GTP-binding protein [Gulosibacter bifidus]
MPDTEVVAIVGSCATERNRYAKTIAAHLQSPCIDSRSLSRSSDPVRDACEQAMWLPQSPVVVDFPSYINPTDIIGTLTDPVSRTALHSLVAVVDAADFVHDLHRDDYLPTYAAHIDEYTAAALVAAYQVEFATDIVIVNWQPLDTAALSQLLALVNALAPTVEVRLHDATQIALPTSAGLNRGQDRCGWVALLNDEHTPHFTDQSVTAFRYQQVRPLHPQRLQQVLDARIEQGEFGQVLRSAGFCTFATRSDFTAAWEHVGQMIAFAPVATTVLHDDAAPVAIGQDIAFFGTGLDTQALQQALDQAALTDAELAAGLELWRTFEDPFPVWPRVHDDAEER